MSSRSRSFLFAGHPQLVGGDISLDRSTQGYHAVRTTSSEKEGLFFPCTPFLRPEIQDFQHASLPLCWSKRLGREWDHHDWLEELSFTPWAGKGLSSQSAGNGEYVHLQEQRRLKRVSVKSTAKSAPH